MIPRHLATFLAKSARAYPVITLTGPRQSGKTTLVRSVFGGKPYVSLENPDDRLFAHEDPRGFLGQYPDGAILDEVQQAPDLLSYLQGIVDAEDRPGRFVLTGSQNLLLLQRVGQSLAGRTAIYRLHPFSSAELRGRPLTNPDLIAGLTPRHAESKADLLATLFTGFYPRIHDRNLDPREWLPNYYQTYIERDVRTLLNVGDLETFGRFVRLCAGRSGQLLNLASMGADCGISHSTARRWLAVLEASFIVYLLRPHHQNFNKRLIKSPKLYFYDTGLLCYLLRIRSAEDLAAHASRGSVFETFVLSELLKAYYHGGREPEVYFWRDSRGHEIDFVVDRGATQIPIEAKSGETIARDFFRGLEYWQLLPGQQESRPVLVYGGSTSTIRNNCAVYAWHDWL